MVHLDPTSYLSHHYLKYRSLGLLARSLLVHSSSSQQTQDDRVCSLGATRERERQERGSVSVIRSREGLRREMERYGQG